MWKKRMSKNSNKVKDIFSYEKRKKMNISFGRYPFLFKFYYQFPQKLSKIAVADGISHRHGGVLVKVFN